MDVLQHMGCLGKTFLDIMRLWCGGWGRRRCDSSVQVQYCASQFGAREYFVCVHLFACVRAHVRICVCRNSSLIKPTSTKLTSFALEEINN